MILFCDIKATEPESVDVLDCTLTHILTQCPRAIRVVGICQGQSNVRKAFIFGTPLATLHFEFVFFFFPHEEWVGTKVTILITHYTFCAVSQHS